MRHLLSAILCVCLFSAPAQADDLGEVSELLQNEGQRRDGAATKQDNGQGPAE